MYLLEEWNINSQNTSVLERLYTILEEARKELKKQMLLNDSGGDLVGVPEA